MKLKNVLLSLGLALGVGAGITGILTENNDSIESFAAIDSTKVQYAGDDTSWADSPIDFANDNGVWTLRRMFDSSKAFKVVVTGGWNGFDNITQGSNFCQKKSDDGNIAVNDSGYYLITVNLNSWAFTIAPDIESVQFVSSADDWNAAIDFEYDSTNYEFVYYTPKLTTEIQFKTIIDGVWWGYQDDYSSLCNGNIDNRGSNVTVKEEGFYKITIGKTRSFKIEKIESSSFNVTFKLDEDTTDRILEVASGHTASSHVPYKFGYSFNGWKLNGEDFDFTTPITSDITLIADWTLMSSENIRYIYVVRGESAAYTPVDWSDRYLFGFKNGSTDVATRGWGEWHGISFYEALSYGTSNGAHLGGDHNAWSGQVYKVPYYTDYGMDKVNFNKGDSSNQFEAELHADWGYVYGGALNEGGASEEIGVIAKLLWDFDSVVRTATSNNGTCAVTPERAAELYQEYLDAVEVNAGWVSTSYINVETSPDVWEDLSLDTIAQGFKSRATKGGVTLSFLTLGGLVDSNNSMALIIVAATIGVFAVGGFFFLRRRKEQ